MELHIDPLLIEAAVVQEIDRRNRNGEAGLCEEYHRWSDPLYELPLKERELEFERLHRTFFRRMGMGEAIVLALDEFFSPQEMIPANPHGQPKLAARGNESGPARDAGLFTAKIRKARSENEEGAFLLRENPKATTEARTIGIRLLPARFLDLAALRRGLQHELMHVADMLDDAFRYEDEPVGSSPHEEAFIIDRYRVIWDIYIDRRLLARGRETVSDKEGRLREFDRVYRKIPAAERLAAFEALWAMETMDHPGMLRLASDPTLVMELADLEAAKEKAPGQRRRVLLPGMACPLCNFPTYVWIEDLEEQLTQAIRGDYPTWGPEEGVCERCADLYRFRLEFPDPTASLAQSQ